MTIETLEFCAVSLQHMEVKITEKKLGRMLFVCCQKLFFCL